MWLFVPNTGAENLGIMFEFSRWVLKICPEDGLKVRSSKARKYKDRKCRSSIEQLSSLTRSSLRT